MVSKKKCLLILYSIFCQWMLKGASYENWEFFFKKSRCQKIFRAHVRKFHCEKLLAMDEFEHSWREASALEFPRRHIFPGCLIPWVRKGLETSVCFFENVVSNSTSIVFLHDKNYSPEEHSQGTEIETKGGYSAISNLSLLSYRLYIIIIV